MTILPTFENFYPLAISRHLVLRERKREREGEIEPEKRRESE